MDLVKYLRSAFVNRWNLLAFLGAGGFAFLSPQPDFLLPLVLAGEALYIGLLASHPKFQKYVDAHEAQRTQQEAVKVHEEALERMLRSLSSDAIARFRALRTRCQSLRQIAADLREPSLSAAPLDKFQLAGLDRLLWIYLRLLYTQQMLSRFLKQTSGEEIEASIRQVEAQLARLPAGGEGSPAHRMRQSLEDNLQTSRDRLANWRKAQDNYQLVEVDIDRLENKIRSLSEMAINRHEPEFISGQVDQVTSSLQETERTMNELRFATGLEALDDSVPELLERKTLDLQR